MEDTCERRAGGSRRDVTREGGRRETDLLKRIRASFPDALEGGPECRHARVVVAVVPACGAVYPGAWQPTSCTLAAHETGTRHTDERRGMSWPG